MPQRCYISRKNYPPENLWLEESASRNRSIAGKLRSENLLERHLVIKGRSGPMNDTLGVCKNFHLLSLSYMEDKGSLSFWGELLVPLLLQELTKWGKQPGSLVARHDKMVFHTCLPWLCLICQWVTLFLDSWKLQIWVRYIFLIILSMKDVAMVLKKK